MTNTDEWARKFMRGLYQKDVEITSLVGRSIRCDELILNPDDLTTLKTLNNKTWLLAVDSYYGSQDFIFGIPVKIGDRTEVGPNQVVFRYGRKTYHRRVITEVKVKVRFVSRYDLWRRNEFTFLISERLALDIKRPESFIKIDNVNL